MTTHEEVQSRLIEFLGSVLDQEVTIRDYEPITGGYSRLMARFTAVRADGQQMRLVMRSDPPAGQAMVETNRSDEWAVVTALHKGGGIEIPEPLWLDEDGQHLGSPAIIYEQINGVNFLTTIVGSEPDASLGLIKQVAGIAADIHRFDPLLLPARLGGSADWVAYVDAALDEWTHEENAHPGTDTFVRLAVAWLRANRPPAVPLSLVHGDLQAANLLARPDGSLVVVDWELAKIGDPREDLGWWILAEAATPSRLIGNDVESFCSAYRQATGMTEDLVNPAILAYFTVFASAKVFFNVLHGIASLTRNETTSSKIAYLTVSASFMHSVWMNAMRQAEEWKK